MAIKQIIYLDGVAVKTVESKLDYTGLAPGNHEIKIESYQDTTLLDTDISNVTVPQPAVSYDSDATAYMNSLGIPDDSAASIYTGKTNHDIWVLADDVITYLKDNAAWTGTHTLHGMIGGTAARHGKNLKDPAVDAMGFYGDWVMSAKGNKGNGANTYAQWGFSPAGRMTWGDAAIVLEITENAGGAAAQYEIGLISASNSNSRAIISPQNTGTDFFGSMGSRASVPTTVTPVGISSVVSNIISGSHKVQFKDTTGAIFHTFDNLYSLPEGSLTYGALNSQGSIVGYSFRTIGAFATCTAAVEPHVRTALQMIKTGLGR